MSKWQSLIDHLRRPEATVADAPDPKLKRFAKMLGERETIDDAVIEAMVAIPREEFVQEAYRADAYWDMPLPIGYGSTISQPSLVGRMISLLNLRPRNTGTVLDLGSGSGYTSAILSQLAKRVIAVERVEPLAEACAERLNRLGFANVEVVVPECDVLGFPQYAPYDAILVSAGAPATPQSLRAQLAPRGRMVIPIGEKLAQRLALVERTGDGDDFKETLLTDCRFVPLIGPDAWQDDEQATSAENELTLS